MLKKTIYEKHFLFVPKRTEMGLGPVKGLETLFEQQTQKTHPSKNTSRMYTHKHTRFGDPHSGSFINQHSFVTSFFSEESTLKDIKTVNDVIIVVVLLLESVL